ncbi:MAG TPA: inositol monophosphatase family protein [Anaerolineales bacterium]|nr:inositol monophosphatase family protein [Anaerolineales bacterium]
MPTLNQTSILSTAVAVARGAGDILKSADANRAADFKLNETDLVTEYDHRAEAYIVAELQKAFPDHAIRGEEGARVNSGAEYEWLIDPLDGTTNFAHGLPIFAVSMALAQRGDPIVGVIYDPSRDELFTTAKGEGAHLNGNRLRVSARQPLSRTLLVTGFPYDIRTNSDNNIARFSHFAVRARAVRRLGSAALDLAYVAAGRIDGYWESRLNLWDVAAGVLMVREAGGRISNYADEPLPIPNIGLVASNGLIHQEMLTVIREGEAAPKP